MTFTRVTISNFDKSYGEKNVTNIVNITEYYSYYRQGTMEDKELYQRYRITKVFLR